MNFIHHLTKNAVLSGSGIILIFLTSIFVPVTESPRIRQLLEMIREDPSDPFCRYALGLEYAAVAQRVDDAIEVFEALRKEQPDYLPTYYQLALLLKSKGRESSCMEVVNEGKALAKITGQHKVYMELDFLIDD